MSRGKKRKTSCASKIAHPTKELAIDVLRRTLPAGMTEEMEPYPCFLCGAWHNGHQPSARFSEFEPICGCKHFAMDHRRFPERGCLICGNRCQSTLEEAYRARIRYFAESAKWRLRFSSFLLRRWPGRMRSPLVEQFNRGVRRRDEFERRSRTGEGCHPAGATSPTLDGARSASIL